MIFYSEFAEDLAKDTYVNLTSALVYKGKQPSSSDYITGVNNGFYTRTGENLLQGYTGIDLKVTKIDFSYRVEKSTASGVLYGDYMNNNGIAEWAVLFHSLTTMQPNKLLEFNNTTNQINFLRNITVDDLFMIVPVTNTAGAGVIRFPSVTFSSTVNNPIEKISLNLY